MAQVLGNDLAVVPSPCRWNLLAVTEHVEMLILPFNKALQVVAVTVVDYLFQLLVGYLLP